MIDKMISELSTQQADEIAHRDWCIDELNSNERSTAAADDKKVNLQTQIADLEKLIEKLTKDIDAAHAVIKETQIQMKRASETREAENADFQETVNNHRVMSMILTKAIDRMKQVYALLQQRALQQPGAPHIQTSGTHTDPGNGPAKFAKMEQNAGGDKVVSMLETVLADSKKLENEAHAAEQEAQNVYENFMKDSNKSIKQLQKANVNMSEDRGKAEEALSRDETDHGATMKTLESLNEELGDIHRGCDFVLNNFSARQEARALELDALREAKQILSGMN